MERRRNPVEWFCFWTMVLIYFLGLGCLVAVTYNDGPPPAAAKINR